MGATTNPTLGRDELTRTGAVHASRGFHPTESVHVHTVYLFIAERPTDLTGGLEKAPSICQVIVHDRRRATARHTL